MSSDEQQRRQRLQDWARQHPNTIPYGTDENRRAREVDRAAVEYLGCQRGDDRYMEMLNREFHGDKAEVSAGNNSVRSGLLDAQKQVAKFSGISEDDYRRGLQELQRHKNAGLYTN